MNGQILDISSPGHFLKLYKGFCLIENAGKEIARIPLDDLDALIIHSTDGILSNQILSAFAMRNIPIIICNEKHNPVGIFWGLQGNYQGAFRLNKQAQLSMPVKKQIWKQIIQAKINNQAIVLKAAQKQFLNLQHFAQAVKSGDTDNREGSAAQAYWPQLLGSEFKRDQDAEGLNCFLNYGYAILRSSVARSIVGVGLHPAFGLFHHNSENLMPLADDFMEPWRPIVDIAVYKLFLAHATALTPKEKKYLAHILDWDMQSEKGQSPLRLCIQQMCLSFVHICLGDGSALTIAQLPQISTIQEEWSDPCDY